MLPAGSRFSFVCQLPLFSLWHLWSHSVLSSAAFHFVSFFFFHLFFQDSRRAKDSPIIASVSQCRQLILRSGTGASFSSLLFLLRLLVVLCRCEMLNAPMHILLTATASSSASSTSSADADVDAACCPQGPLLSCAALSSRGPLLPSVSVFL